MLRSIVQSSLKARYVVLVLTVAVVVLGLSRLRDMPIDVLPEFALPYVEIQTEALGLSAEEVEQLITLGMEQDLLNGVPWVETIRSESMPGLSSITIVFKRGTDLMKARQLVAERLAQAYALPHVSKPPVMLQPRSATSRVMIVGLSSKTLSPIQMSVLARWTIVPRLKGVPGVANVAIWGQRDRQLQVQVDPKRLIESKVSLLQVLETTGNALWYSTLSFVEASTPGSGGFIDTRNQRLGIRHVMPIVSAEGLSEMPIEGSGKKLADVARVVEDHPPLIGDALTKSGAGLLLVIEKFPDTNTLDVTEDVETALHELQPGLPGMDVNSNVYRPADFIVSAMKNLGTAMMVGLGLLLVLMLLFFRNWRSALIGFVTVPLSVFTAAVVLQWTGSSLNAIVLTGFAMAVGVIAYDAIVDVDRIVRRLGQSASGASKARVILEAALEPRRTLLYATAILLLAAAPLFGMGGASGPFFQSLGLSYATALLASMVVAWTVTPMLCSLLLSPGASNSGSSPFVSWLESAHASMLSKLVPSAGLAFIVAAVLGIVAIVLMPNLHPAVLPHFQERNLVVRLRTMPGTSQPEMSRLTARAQAELLAIPGVSDVSAHIGRAILGDQAVDVHSGELWVSIDPKADYDKATNAIQKVIDGYPGVSHRVETYLGQVSEDVVAAPEDKLVTRVYGETEAGLRERAEQVRQAIAGVNGIKNPTILRPIQEAAIETNVDVTAAQKYGLKPGDVRRAAATLMSGVVVGNLYEEQKIFEVVVWSTPETRQSLSSFQDLLIDTPSGGRVRLGDVAKVRIVPASSVIKHDAVKRYIDVAADVEGRDLVAVAGDISKQVATLEFPLEYHAEVQGGFTLARLARERMLTFAIAAAIGIFFLFQAAFSSWRLAALAFWTLPAAIAGGVLSILASGGALSMSALAGLLAVFSIAVYHRLTLVHRFQSLERSEGMKLGKDLVMQGARDCVPSMMLATLAAAAAMLPVLFLGHGAGFEMVRPMAIVVIGGLVSCTVLDLLLLPSMFLALGVSSALEPDPFHETVPSHGYIAAEPSGAAGH